MDFSSDSTYCSLYENKQSQKRKCKTPTLTDSKFLDKIHKEVILHFEGKKLLGRVEVVQYMKQISKMNLKNPRNQCFAEKIQSSLCKIYKLLRQFEESLSIGTVSPMLDIIENYSFAKDFPILPVDNENPKQILLQTTTVNDEESSFPLEILTNDNFISSSQQNIYTPFTNFLTKNEIITKEAQLAEIEKKENEMNTDCFLSENSEVNIKTCSVSSVEAVISTDHHYLLNLDPVTLNSVKIADSTKNRTDVSDRNINQFNCINISSNNEKLHCISQDNALKDKGKIENFTPAADNLENCNTIEQISKICANLSTSHKYNATISETVNFQYENVSASMKNLNLTSVTDLGNLFKESYNSNIYNLLYGTGKNLNKNKTWPEIESDMANREYLAGKVYRNLEELSKQLHLESGSHKMQHIMLREKSFHNFNEEDNAKLNIEGLMDTNKARLEHISQEFQQLFNSKQNITEEKPDEFQEII